VISLTAGHQSSRQNTDDTGDSTVSGPLFALVELGNDVIEINAERSSRLRPKNLGDLSV
jgi:hypothetical protein